jgi:peptidylprolyl isomerase
MGNFTIELYDDMPKTSENFRNLVSGGYYDGTIFHRVIYRYLVQGGDLSGKGISWPTISDELPNQHSNVNGSVAMAKTSDSLTGKVVPNSATSQFYVNLRDNSYLDSNYVVFGHVIDGLDVVERISEVPTDTNNKPFQDVWLISARII